MSTAEKLKLRRVLATWWPLAASWLLMSAELPVISAFIARLSNPAINLAAYGSVVFPLALIIEAPVIMLLAASTALCKDIQSYYTMRRYMTVLSTVLTGIHLLVALTPLFDWVVKGLLGVPEQTVEPSRIGFLIMTPWTWSIAYRRFNQGVLIRFGKAKVISLGTLVRLTADVSVLTIGYLIRDVSGVAIAALAVAVGVLVEAVFVGIKVRPVVRGDLTSSQSVATELTVSSFLSFYVPLAATSFLMLCVQPISSASLSRMPEALPSLAVWPVVFGLMFMLRCMGHAYQEVVVALMGEEGAEPVLRYYALLLIGITSSLLLVIAATPLSRLWFESIAGLSIELGELARKGIWFGLLFPAFSVIQNWFQGILVYRRQTRGITESVAVFLFFCTAVLWCGVKWGEISGLYVGLVAFTIGGLAQVSWLWYRLRRGSIQSRMKMN